MKKLYKKLPRDFRYAFEEFLMLSAIFVVVILITEGTFGLFPFVIAFLIAALDYLKLYKIQIITQEKTTLPSTYYKSDYVDEAPYVRKK